MAETWTISELAEEAAARLASRGLAQESGRVRDTPNARLIRWYTTIGLLDPPLRNGRHALYGRRHLAQLIAVKRRQAEGRPLAEIQAELAGAADSVLEEIAGIPELPREPAAQGPPRPRFWAERPAIPQGSPRPPPPTASSDPAPAPALVQGVRLAPEVTLLLGRTGPPAGDGPGGKSPSPDDLAALAAAARPLLAELARRGLISEGDDQ